MTSRSFQNDAVQVLAISVDSVYAHKIFAEREGYEFPLLSDFWPHGGVAPTTARSTPTRAWPTAARTSSTAPASCGGAS